MLIDRKAILWIVGSLAIFAVATAFYFPYARQSGGHPSGGSRVGLAYGCAGSAAMAAAMLLAARRQTRSWRLGRMYYWMQAHVWLGLLSYPLIIYHAGGFTWGGTLTQTLMWIFSVVIASGIVGLMLQQIIPRKMTRAIAAETIHDQIEHVLEAIREEAEAAVETMRNAQSEAPQTTHGPHGRAAATLQPAVSASAPVLEFYAAQVAPFLGNRYLARSPLARERSAREAFDGLRVDLPAEFVPVADTLELLVGERRQLARQRRLHRWLHGWLLVHVPLSYVLLVLAIIHAVMAFRYTSPGR